MHDLPDFVYFNHSIHVNKGVGCTTCHGQVDRMPLMWQEQSLQMEWCLDCHRNPERYVRPREAVLQRRLRAAAQSARARQAPRRRVPDSEAHQLLDVPPMTHRIFRARSPEPTRVNAGERSRSGLAIRRFANTSAQRVSVADPTGSITDPVAAPHVPEADGRVARARRRHAPARDSRRRRSSRTSASPRS